MISFLHLTDQDLLECIRHDDEKAFSELFRRYWRKVHIMAYKRVRSKDVTEEIVQELFASLWDKRATLAINNLNGYLFKAVKYKALNYVESRLLHEKHWEYFKKYVPQYEYSTTSTIEFNELKGAIEDGIGHLPEKTREVFRLNRMEGHSIPEIARLLNLSEKAIQYHVTKSVKMLRVHLRELMVC